MQVRLFSPESLHPNSQVSPLSLLLRKGDIPAAHLLLLLLLQLLRYKSHLLERLHPWTRFAATSRTYGCEAETLRAKAEADQGAAAAAATAASALAAAGDDGLYGGGSNVPTEWEGPASADPPAAAAEVFRTEAAERAVPQLQVAYAYDEDTVSACCTRRFRVRFPERTSGLKHISNSGCCQAASLKANGASGGYRTHTAQKGGIRLLYGVLLLHCCVCFVKVSVHPGFLHIAFGVKDVPAAVKFIRAFDEAAAQAAAKAEAATGQCKTCDLGVSGPANLGAAEIVGDAEDVAKATQIESESLEECLLRNFEGYPILLVKEQQAAAYYRALQEANNNATADA